MQAHYYTAFDVTASGYRNWWFPAFGLIFVAIGLLWSLVTRRGSQKVRTGGVIYLGFAVLWVGPTFITTYRDYRQLSRALSTKSYEVVEGQVTDFISLPKVERFRVGSHTYEYSDFTVTAGFNRMSSRGGPVRPGLQVRIADVNGSIARLEIAR
ncbi:MAG TPA: hypothetical protein VHX14_10555 [Thermoanaerobaculia bacterium]|jgi:hypothetical protein|nr:hypothetical protein [Thermoanaerobaculia bacterium]